jgi:hypothetical protein
MTEQNYFGTVHIVQQTDSDNIDQNKSRNFSLYFLEVVV